MFEHTSPTSGMHDVISTGVVSLDMKTKYASVKNMSKSPVIWMQPSSHLMPAMLPIPMVMIPKGPEHSREHSEHSSGPRVSKS